MRNIIICGLGALGVTYAVKLAQSGICDLRILVDEARLKKYITKKPIFNGTEQNFNYILPNENFDADLIIIAVKASGLKSVIKNIKNFVSKKTIIISLINGISSEREILQVYPEAKVLKSYFIGHSAEREGNNIIQDGIGKIVVEHNAELEEFFKKTDIAYEMPKDIDYSMWLKFALNIISNQTSAILKMSFGEMRENKNFFNFSKKVIKEVSLIAKQRGIKNSENLESEVLNSIQKMSTDGKTSMLQDVLAKRPTEVDIFAGEIIKLGEKYGVPTPYNQVLYDLIKIEEEKNEHSIHTC